MSKNKKSKRTMLSYLSFVIIIIIIYIALGSNNLINKDLNSKIFVINKGKVLIKISNNLEKQDIIKMIKYFKLLPSLKM